jgi:hypothetical protein
LSSLVQSQKLSCPGGSHTNAGIEPTTSGWGKGSFHATPKHGNEDEISESYVPFVCDIAEEEQIGDAPYSRRSSSLQTPSRTPL